MKEIICEEQFDSLLTDRLDNSPMALYDFTNNINFPTQEEVKSKMMNNYLFRAIANQNELNATLNNTNRRNHVYTRANISSQQSENSKEKLETNLKNLETSFDNNFTESEENKIENKYLQEIIAKNCFSTVEVNEKMILVNQQSRNLIHSIIDNTFSNIIAEAIFGETDLSEQTKIFFYKN